jgi:hypothetical protein
LVELHGRALGSYEELAACVRGFRGQDVIEAAARRNAPMLRGVTPLESQRQAEAKAREKFESAIARQLYARGVCEPSAGMLVDEIPQLRARLDAAVQRHAAHARHEAERLAHEHARQREADEEQARLEREAGWRAVLAAESLSDRKARESLASWYAQHGAFTFQVLGESVTGTEACRRLKMGAPYIEYFRAQPSGTAPARVRA